MKINGVCSVFNCFQYKRNNFSVYNNQLPCDTVSFSGKKNKNISERENIIEAANVGKEIYNLLINGASKADVANLLESRSKNLSVKSIEAVNQIGRNPDDYNAFFSSKISPEITPLDSVLYLDMSTKPMDKTSKFLFALDVAHEYTHYLQDKDFYKFLKDLSGGDDNYASLITGFGDLFYANFDDSFIQINILKAVEPQDFLPYLQYKQMIPRIANVTKQNILTKNGIRNTSEFRKIVSDKYNNIVVDVLKYLINDPKNVPPEVLDTLSGFDSKDFDKLFSDVKKYVQYNIKKEKEANMTESRLSKKILGTKDSINKDLYVNFFELLEDSFQ